VSSRPTGQYFDSVTTAIPTFENTVVARGLGPCWRYVERTGVPALGVSGGRRCPRA
jgi:hypothetical protein